MGRGRPKGSKNKPKTEAAPVTATVVKKKPGRKPKTLVPPPPNEKATETELVRVIFHMDGDGTHQIIETKEVGNRIAKEWASLGNSMQVAGGHGWAIRMSEVLAVIVEPVKKRGRPAGKK